MVDVRARIAQVEAGSAWGRVRYPIRLRQVEVLSTAALGTALRRVTLGGPGLAGFQSHLADEHVRVVLPDEHGELRLPVPDGDDLRWPRPLPVSREYTVRRHDADAGELDVDVALHPGGLGSDWALAAAPGDRVHVAGPPGGIALPPHERYLFGGDVTALPQIARFLERLPGDATGRAVVEVADAGEEIPLPGPVAVEVQWVRREPGVPAGRGDALEQALRTAPPVGRTFVWIAGEAGVLRPLRRWVRHELDLPPSDVLITGYWKRGVADFDEEH